MNLNYTNTRFEGEAFKQLRDSIARKEFGMLDLSNAGLRDRELIALADAVSRNVLELDISENEFSSAGLKKLGESLKNPEARLKSLVMRNVRCKSEDMATFLQALTCNRSLKLLDISGIRLESSDVGKLANCIRFFSLRVLILGEVKKSDLGVIQKAFVSSEFVKKIVLTVVPEDLSETKCLVTLE